MSIILDLIFPELCVGCKNYTAVPKHPYICRDCFKTIPDHHISSCIGCNRPTKDDETCILCRKDYQIDAVHVVSDYKNKNLQNLIHCLKYKFVPTTVLSLAAVTSKYLAYRDKNKKPPLFGSSSLIIPVPLHKRRLNWRGFNQSELLAQIISDRYLIASNHSCLIRTASSKPQAEIKTKEERLSNLTGSFTVLDPDQVRGKDIVLIDDVCTTGTTLNECANVLKTAGAKTVVGLVIAKG